MQTEKQNQTNAVSFVLTQKNHQNILQQFNQVIITMGVIIKDNKLVIITEPKAIHFNLPKHFGNNLTAELIIS